MIKLFSSTGLKTIYLFISCFKHYPTAGQRQPSLLSSSRFNASRSQDLIWAFSSSCHLLLCLLHLRLALCRIGCSGFSSQLTLRQTYPRPSHFKLATVWPTMCVLERSILFLQDTALHASLAHPECELLTLCQNIKLYCFLPIKFYKLIVIFLFIIFCKCESR